MATPAPKLTQGQISGTRIPRQDAQHHGCVTVESVAAELEQAGHGRHRRQLRALHRALAGTNLALSAHAVMRAQELGFDLIEVVTTARYPQVSYPDTNGRRILQRNDIAVVTADRDNIVVTVLLRCAQEWVHGRHTRRTLPMS